jgi:nucleotide-binding universal stress UspA family protein
MSTNRPVQTILVATGLTPESVGGLAMGIELSKRERAALHVVHVVEPPSDIAAKAIPGLCDRHTKLAVDELGKFCDSHGVPGDATRHVLCGNAESEILKLRAQLKADVLVVGRYGQGGLKRGRIGSIANRLVRKCQVSVLVAHPEYRSGLQRVGVACDFHEDSQMELCRALQLAKDVGAEEVVILSAYEVPAGYHTVMTWEEACERLETALREAAGRSMAMAAKASPGAPAWRLRLEEGSPEARVPAMAQEEHLDLLVLGTHGRSRAAMALLGRTSEKIIDAAGCSVWAERDAKHFQGWLEVLKEWAE